MRNGARRSLTRPLDTGSRSRRPCRRFWQSRIDRFPAAEKDLLQTLAVIGREFPTIS